ncbi:MAG: hypothetical protein JRE73_13650 [Deltaproteobacteria bacterium]|nr:hypothetical protein [Deltaproteobacteria bacterium]
MKYLLLFLLSLAVVGCGTKDPKPVTSPGSGRSESTSGSEVADGGRCVPDGAGYEVTEYDTSGDDTPDVRKLFQTMGEGSLARLVAGRCARKPTVTLMAASTKSPTSPTGGSASRKSTPAETG